MSQGPPRENTGVGRKGVCLQRLQSQQLVRRDICPAWNWLRGLPSSESHLFLVVGQRGKCKGNERAVAQEGRPLGPGFVCLPWAIASSWAERGCWRTAPPHSSSPSTPTRAHSLATSEVARLQQHGCSGPWRATQLGGRWPAGGSELPARAHGGPQTSRPGDAYTVWTGWWRLGGPLGGEGMPPWQNWPGRSLLWLLSQPSEDECQHVGKCWLCLR